VICSVADCPREAKVKGWCIRHYRRWYRHGDPLVILRREERQPCAMEGCHRLNESTGGLCGMHRKRVERHGNPHLAPPRHYYSGADHPAWKGDGLSYRGIHTRLRVLRGRASQYPCVSCGEPAVDWSYSHDDPNEKLSAEGWPYSSDASYYSPRCRSCHCLLDKGRAHPLPPQVKDFDRQKVG
jgi:hypothetical protein